jgi:hypothetical protein
MWRTAGRYGCGTPATAAPDDDGLAALLARPVRARAARGRG